MKKWILFLALPAMLVCFVGCPVNGPSEADLEVIDEAAQAKASEGLSKALDAALTGDREELDAFIAAEDTDGTLSDAFDAYFASAETSSRDALSELLALAQSLNMVVWYNGVDGVPVQPGDVLLFAADGSTWQNMLMSLALVNPYFSHAGIVDPEKLLTGDDKCILSATIDLGGEEGFVSGATYQSLAGLKETNLLIIRLPYEIFSGWVTPPQIAYSMFAAQYNDETTDYAFVTLDMNLDAIGKYDEDYFYCSKVPWVIYMNSLVLDIEQDGVVDYYETYTTDRDARWTLQRESLLYKLYKFFLLVEGAPWWKISKMADQHVKEVLRELVSPDELLAAFAFQANIPLP